MPEYIVLSEKDNVATALKDLEGDMPVVISTSNEEIRLKEAIQFGHKFAVKDIEKGQKIYKYGEVIGVAVQDITVGSHVHVHNLEGTRGRGDK